MAAFYFKGSNHRSVAYRMWEARQTALKEKKEHKHARKKIRRAIRKQAGRPKISVIARCKIRQGETAAQAMDRSIAESRLSQQSWYRQIYLESEHWRTTRRQARARVGGVCQACGGCPESVDVHHLRYRNIFDVTMDDLQVLCRACHDKEHEDDQIPM